jgi:hypothetical protein
MNRVCLLLVALGYLSMVGAQQAAESSPIGYATIEDAFTALQADPQAVMTEYEGWVIFKQKSGRVYTLWSFTPEDHPTHPTAIRREIVKRGDEVSIKMDALCHSSKLDCDQLIDEFKAINERIKQNLAGASE